MLCRFHLHTHDMGAKGTARLKLHCEDKIDMFELVCYWSGFFVVGRKKALKCLFLFFFFHFIVFLNGHVKDMP